MHETSEPTKQPSQPESSTGGGEVRASEPSLQSAAYYRLRAARCEERAHAPTTRFPDRWSELAAEYRYLEAAEQRSGEDALVGTEPAMVSRSAEPAPKPLWIADLARAKDAIASTEMRLLAQTDEIERLRASALPTSRAEALELETREALWHQRGLAFEIRKFLTASH